MGTHPIFESDFDCLTDMNEELVGRLEEKLYFNDSTKPEHSTKTTKSQLETQQKYCERIQYFVDNAEILKVQLDKEKHIKYCIKGLESLSSSYEGLDSSRPWLVYWTVHALDLLDYHCDTSLKSKIVNFLALCQNEDGGFGGGPGQISHLATSYAAMNAIAIMGADGFSDAYSIINKEAMKSFLMRVKSNTGCFQMHVNGEEDTRAAYCACSIAAMLKFDIKSELFNNTINYLVSCQNWDGGFGPNPGAESHGGYTFTSLAALTILNGLGDIRDSDSLIRWLCNRQMTVEGGFSGRANKLVDSCYNFWQGGSFPIVQNLLDPVYKDKNHWICDEKSLHEYTLFGSQWRDQTGYRGGFGDRPGAHRDYYHTCYALSGLAAMSYVYDDSGNLVKHDIGQEQSVALLNSIHNVRPVAVLDIYDFFTTH